MTTIVLPGALRRYRAYRHTPPRQHLHAAARWLRQTCCAVNGHHFLICRERQRICLECTDCGYQTPGWRLSPVKAGRS